MLRLKTTTKFRKEFRKIAKSGKDMNELYNVITILQQEKTLPILYKDHALKGKWKGYRECHIEPDWLLIYRIYKNELLLELTRTGSHSDIF